MCVLIMKPLSYSHVIPFLCVLVLAGMELAAIIVADVGLCFEFALNTRLII